VLDAYVFDAIEQVREITDTWLREYNEERPHGSLGRVPPLMFMPRPLTVRESSSKLCPWRGSLRPGSVLRRASRSCDRARAAPGTTLRVVTLAPPAPHAPLDASVGGSMLDATRENPTPIVEVPILALAGRRAITGLERQQREFRRQ
jgi:hypothetical protein